MLNFNPDADQISAPDAASGTAGQQGASILIVDNEPGLRDDLRKALASRYALVEIATSIDSAEALRQRCHFDLFVVSMRLSGESGVVWQRKLRDAGVRSDVIFMTDYADLDTAVAALRAGASDLLVQPFRIEQMLASIKRCLDRREMMRENFLLRRRSVPPRTAEGLIGDSAVMQDLHRIVNRIAATASTVLVEGETGTGKELVARAIHKQSGRKGAFVAVNCGSISSELLESELFGHTRGAFTGAHAAREGLFGYANNGTIFLDEIGELPLPLQANLLRVLEEKRVRPVGSDREVEVSCRVIAATNVPLAEQVQQAAFREDLYYRLNVLRIVVPPLRDRLEDIPALAHYFAETLASEIGVAPVPFGHNDFVHMQDYDWPGNVRELKNVIERSLLLGRLPGDCCHGGTGVPAGRGGSQDGGGFPLGWTLSEVEKQHMLRVLDSVGGNKSEAARRLGISRKTLDRKLQAWAHGGTD
ncbi:MAG: sigma-54 dependent transcriptional regulator [Gammaproteobacteria bacterium]